MFLDKFDARELSSLRFKRPAASFARTYINKTAN